MDRVGVLLPLPLTGVYDYRVPAGMRLQDGDFVEVPLGPRRMAGVVWGAGQGAVAEERLRPVARRFDIPPMAEVNRRFIDWVARYTLSPPGPVLKMALSVPEALEAPRQRPLYRLAETLPEAIRPTPARQRVLTLLADGVPRGGPEIADLADCGSAVVRGLAEAGALIPVFPAADTLPQPDWQRPGPTLSPEQAAAAAVLRQEAERGEYVVSLLDGVTGSGKTEVYCEAIAGALSAGRQVLVLLPEIALSAQWLQRFARRFGAPPGLWHSELSQGQRRTTWRAVAEGRVSVVVGARSALFLPYPHLGLIVVDEEHDPAFKQDEGVCYQGRDMAVARAWLGKIPAVLVSATPSLETTVNTESGRYARLHLPGRHGGAELPDIRLVDLRTEKPDRHHWLAPPVRQALAETLAAGEQAMVFLNRRGYAPLTLCRACGHRLKCPNCTAWLVEHRHARHLRCHHCGFNLELPETCPACLKPDSFTACGPGVERVAEELTELFPQARMAVMTSDTLSGPAAVEQIIQRILGHELDLIVGTQVMAKGHHFPMLTLVVVVDADLGLGGGDMRAAERTYQLLHQVAGRAGRAERPGRVLLQSYLPEHPVMQALAAGDRDRFLALEAEERRDAHLPPYARLAALIVSGEDEAAVDHACQTLARTAPHSESVIILGPAPAPLAILRGRHRRRFLIKGERNQPLQPVLRTWLARQPSPLHGVKIQVDVDPYSFL